MIRWIVIGLLSFALLVVGCVALTATIGTSTTPTSTPIPRILATPSHPNPTLTTPRPTAQLVATKLPVRTPSPSPTLSPTNTPSVQPTTVSGTRLRDMPVNEPTLEPLDTPEPGPSNTPDPTPTPTPEPQLGHRENPVPLNQPVEILRDDKPYWAVTITKTIPDATEIILSMSSASLPKTGNQYYALEVEAKYLGPESTTFNRAMSFDTVGQSAVVHSSSCPYNPGENFPFNTEVFTTGAIRGWICFEIPTADADSLELFININFSDERIWFILE